MAEKEKAVKERKPERIATKGEAAFVMIALVAILVGGTYFKLRYELLMILVAVLMYSGSVPMIIYYGLMVVNPQFLYVSAFILCAIMSTATGSSWSSAGTAAVSKKPVIPCMILTILAGLVLGWLIQGFTLERGFYFALNGFNLSSVLPDFEGSQELLTLLNRGGAKSMAGVVIMCFAGFSCAAIIARAQFLDVLLTNVHGKLNSRPKAMGAALLTNIFIMIATGTAYIAFIMVSEMYRKIFIQNKMGIPALSRSLEDIGTCLGCLIPWSLSGAYYAGLFALPIWGEGGYAFWTVVPYVTPVIAMILAFVGLGMYTLTDEERDQKLAEIEAITDTHTASKA